MMIKLCDYDAFDKNGEPTVIYIGQREDTIKTAALSSLAYAPEINSFISTIRPEVGKLYTLINAMGATEFFSCNRNGDAFYEDALKKWHHTFVTDGHPYMHHKNKDPEKSYGKVIFSAYNDKMHRVELIVAYDLDRLDPKFASRIENGEMVNVSMGCRVDADYCSICGNKAKSPAFYCEHLRDNPGLTKCLPDGRKAFAINKEPHFFDISIVTIPADPTARVMAKIASSCGTTVSSVKRAYEDTTFLDMIGEKRTVKTADAVSRIISIDENPTSCIETKDLEERPTSPFTDDQEEAICRCCSELCNEFDRAFGPDIPNNILDAIGNLSFNPISLLKGFLHKNIFLRPRESQRITLISLGKPGMADLLDKKGIVISGNPCDASKFFDASPCDESGVRLLTSDLLNSRSLLPDNIRKVTIRVIIGEGNEKDAGLQPVTISDDMKYLLASRGDGGIDANLLTSLMLADNKNPEEQGSVTDTLKTLGLLGAIISTIGALGGGRSIAANPILTFNQLGRISNNAMSQFGGIGATNPIQEMQFLNPNGNEAIQAALMNAMLQTEILDTNSLFQKQSSLKLADGWSDIWNKTLPKMAITLPAAWGIGTFLANKAEEDDMKSYNVTGKYDPSYLSRRSLAIPIAAAALWKFAEYRGKARDFIKKGEKIGLNKKSLLADAGKIVYDKNDITDYHKVAGVRTGYYPY